jgi:peptidoglycan/xylan/chitin deacetylase (PgdA/CDA1 family)
MSGVALTFDDGPDARWTPVLLDRLAELNAPATFFPISSRATRHPELIARVRREGHEIGLHGAFHLDHQTTPTDVLEDDTQLALDWLGEPSPQLWRPPWGRVSPASVVIARRHGLRLVTWTVDTEDWRASATTASMLDRVTPELRDGAVLLMHDAVGPAPRDERRDSAEGTLDLVAPLVAAIRERGLEPTLIDRAHGSEPLLS